MSMPSFNVVGHKNYGGSSILFNPVIHPAAGVSDSSYPVSTVVAGGLYFDTTAGKHLKVHDGTAWVVVPRLDYAETLTATWNINVGSAGSPAAPFALGAYATAVVTNLNADLLDGHHSGDFLVGPILGLDHGGTGANLTAFNTALVYCTGSGFALASAGFYWDNANKWVGINLSPTCPLTVSENSSPAGLRTIVNVSTGTNGVGAAGDGARILVGSTVPVAAIDGVISDVIASQTGDLALSCCYNHVFSEQIRLVGGATSKIKLPALNAGILQLDANKFVTTSNTLPAGVSVSGLTQGSVLFAGASGTISQDNANLFWDSTNHRLGIENSNPRSTLDVGSNNISGAAITLGYDGGVITPLTIQETRRLNYGDEIIGKNLGGVSGADTYQTLYTKAAGTGYSGIELRYAGDIYFYGSNVATTSNTVITPQTNVVIKGDTGNVGIGMIPGSVARCNVLGAGTWAAMFGGTSSGTDWLAFGASGGYPMMQGYDNATSNAVNICAQPYGGALIVGGAADLGSGILQLYGGLTFSGARTLQTTTGNLTLQTGGGNGNILLTPNGTGSVLITYLTTNNVLYAGASGAVTGLAVNSSATVTKFLTQVNSAAPAWTDLFGSGNTWGGDQIFNGTVTVANAPVAGTDAANKTYVDNHSTGLRPLAESHCATSAALPANTNSGGVLTASANGSINATGIDGITTLSLNDTVLVKNESTKANNGLYYLSQVGDGANPWKLTRRSDANTAATITQGAYSFVRYGTNAGTSWVQQDVVTTINTDPIEWNLFFQQVAISFGAVTGTCAVSQGGTGATNAADARTNLGLTIGTNVQAAGNYITALTGDATAAGPGSVALTLATVNANVGTYNNVTVNAKGLVTAASNVAYLTANQTITLSGDVSGSGTTAIAVAIGAGKITNTMISGPIDVAHGGTGASSAASARANLGLVIGTNVQAWSATLDNIIANTWAGATSITTLGTIASGVWNGTAIAWAKIATGTANRLVVTDGSGNLTTSLALPTGTTLGSATVARVYGPHQLAGGSATERVSHNLNSTVVGIMLFDYTNQIYIEGDYTRHDDNSIDVVASATIPVASGANGWWILCFA